MKFDSLGLPSDNGAFDRQDSVRLAGLMALFEYPKAPYMRKYFVPAGTSIPRYLPPQPTDTELVRDPITPNQYITKDSYVRHPLEYIYDLSRDQYIDLIAGLWAQGMFDLVDQEYVTGIDIMSPAVKGHEARCKGRKATWLQAKWLWFDVWFHAKISIVEEPNQLLAMMIVAAKTGNPEYLKWWVENNPYWKITIETYFRGWRGEPEFANHMINYVLKLTTAVASV